MGTTTTGTTTIGTTKMWAMATSTDTTKGEDCIEILGDEFVTTEVIEDHLVCGIEILPSKSSGDSVATGPTYPITTDSSGSWSLSSNSLLEIITDISEDIDGNGNDQAQKSYSLPYAATQSPLCCNAGSSMENYASMEAYADVVCSPVYGRRRRPKKKCATKSPAPVKQCDVQEERTRVEMVLVMKLDMDCLSDSERDCVTSDCVTSDCLASDCVASDCVVSDCVARDCKTSDCVASDCVASERVASERAASERVASERVASECAASECASERVASDCARRIINLMDPEPDLLFNRLISRTTSLLCRMSLKATDLPFLHKSVTHSPSNGFALQPPFVMFPNKSSVFVAKHKESDIYQLMSRGPIPVDSLPQLFDIQDHMDGLFVSVLAFHDGIPALVGKDPLALDGNNFSILLDDWRRKRKRSPRNGLTVETNTHTNTNTRALSPLKPRSNMQIDVDDEYGNFVCNPGLLPLMTSPKSNNDDTNLLQDDELRAIMKITQNGNDTSALFPCFFEGSGGSFAESDDGLGAEMGALESLQKDLQVELHIAEVIVNEAAAKPKDIGTEKTPINPTLLPIRKRVYTILRSQTPRPSPRPSPQEIRRVRFSNKNEEHIFVSEITSRSDESGDDYYGCEFHFDDYTYAIEDVFEEFTNAFREMWQQFKPRQPRGRVANRSNMHFF
jgi:hypothetical protein